MADKSDFVIAFLFFFGGGLICLLVGLIVQTGKMKRWWIIYSTPLTPIGWFYLSIPLSIVFFTWGLVMLIPDLETRGKLFEYVFYFGFVPSIVLAILRPRWLIPAWLRWLEDNHGDIIDLLRDEARQMGGREWDRQVSTQKGLEQWVAEVRRKHGL